MGAKHCTASTARILDEEAEEDWDEGVTVRRQAYCARDRSNAKSTDELMLYRHAADAAVVHIP